MATLADVNITLLEQNQTLDRSEKSIEKLSTNLSSFLKVLSSDRLKNLESQREAGDVRPADSESDGLSPATTGLFAGLGGMLGGMLAGVGPILLGLSGAILASFSEFANDVSRTFASFFVIGPAWKKIFDSIKAVFSPDGFIGGFIQTIRKTVLNMMFLGEDGKPIAKVFKGMQGAQGAGPIAKFFRFLRNMYISFETLVGSPIFKAVGSVIDTLGPILKRIFLPIGLIFTAYDTVKGAIEGYGEEGFVGALTGAVSGLFASIVGAPLNLIKSITAWVLEKLGFDETSESIAGLDFEQMIKDIGMAAAKWINGIIDWIKNFDIGEALSGLGEKAWDGIKSWLSGKPDAEVPAEMTEPVQLFKGTVNAAGSIFKDFGAGTPAILHGEEAVIPKASALGKVLDQAYGGGSNIELGQNLTPVKANMESIQDSIPAQLKNIAATISVNPTIPKGPSNNELGNIFSTMVREAQQIKTTGSAASQPVIIQDNSSRVVGGSTTSSMAVQSTPYDFNDPFVKGLRA